jgi:dTDP-4-dehydrorhamnose 3,5-epimerase
VIFQRTSLIGAWRIEPEPIADDRGLFARVFCRDEFAEHDLNTQWLQCSVSYNRQAGTLRGLHYQKPPHGEIKLIRCTAGAVYDVIVDLRPGSPTRFQWFATELSARNRHMLYVPKGLAHGFYTLTDGAELYYQMSAPYAPEATGGCRWNDPKLGIEWPGEPKVISPRDAGFADLSP